MAINVKKFQKLNLYLLVNFFYFYFLQIMVPDSSLYSKSTITFFFYFLQILVPDTSLYSKSTITLWGH
jgi:hypothetical protein